MTAEITANDVVTFGDLRLLAGAGGPCITMVVHIPSPFELSARLKNALRRVEKELKDRATGAEEVESLLAPVHGLAGRAEAAGVWSNALILFRAPGVFRHFWLYRRVPEVESVDDRFQIRPLLPAFAREQRFHLLGLSRRHIRLWHCGWHRAEEASLRGVVPSNMRVWLSTSQPDHVLDNRSKAGPSVGSMKGVVFGTGTDREHEDENIAHFFKEVDKGVNILLRGAPARLLLAGVESEVAIYRRVSSYPRLFEKAVPGSPDGLAEPELHKRAMEEVVMETPSEPLEKALADFEKHRDDINRVPFDARTVIKAAWEGRVADLFLSEGAVARGSWNEETHEVQISDSGEDLLNAAALHTVAHGGRAFVLERRDMPLPHEVAAVLRF